MKSRKTDIQTILKNFQDYWAIGRETYECFTGIALLLGDYDWTGKGELAFDADNAPIISLEGENWQVRSVKIRGSYELELHLANNDITKEVCISDDDIEKLEAYKLFQAVYDNTEHEKDEGEDFEDIEDFYGWELS